MKIALIGPGIMPIPPPGWGAVEILIWDYYLVLRDLGHDVSIINTPNTDEIVSMVNWGKFDFVHLHYDVFFHILDRLICPKIAITTHYPYIDNLEKHRMDGYTRIFDFLVKQQQYYHFVLADKDYKTFLNNDANPSYLYRMKNGINSNLFRFSNNATLDRTIYLGKITSRKNQAKYQLLEGVDFVGNCDDNQFDVSRSNYLGHWTREQLHNKLTNYTNLLLISNGEADPLVVKEALVSGLGVIINKSSAENLDVTKEFITVLDDDKLDDIGYICVKIIENRLNCMGIRNKIREYGIINFDIVERVKTYLEMIR